MSYLLELPAAFTPLFAQYVPSAFRCSDPGPLTTAQAHQVMQEHLECDAEWCRVRRTAVAVLVEAGHLVPDSGRLTYLTD